MLTSGAGTPVCLCLDFVDDKKTDFLVTYICIYFFIMYCLVTVKQIVNARTSG